LLHGENQVVGEDVVLTLKEAEKSYIMAQSRFFGQIAPYFDVILWRNLDFFFE